MDLSYDAAQAIDGCIAALGTFLFLSELVHEASDSQYVVLQFKGVVAQACELHLQQLIFVRPGHQKLAVLPLQSVESGAQQCQYCNAGISQGKDESGRDNTKGCTTFEG